MRTLFRTCLLTAALFSAASGVALADSAALDASFGQPTVIDTDNNHTVAHLARPGGGSVGVFRWTSTTANCPSGRTCVLITVYSETGVALGERTFSSFRSVAAAALDSTGRIVIVGAIDTSPTLTQMRVVRLLPSGLPDLSFDDDGIRDLGFGTSDEANAVAIDARDRIVVAGTVRRTATDYDFGVVRLLNNGSNDPSFWSGGIRPVPFDLATFNQSDAATEVAVTRAGKIVLAGNAFDGPHDNYRIAMAQLLDNGDYDVSFCASSCNFQGPFTAIHSGRRVTYFGTFNSSTEERITALAVDSVGNSVIAGSSYSPPNSTSFAMRLAANGNWTAEVAINGGTAGATPPIGSVHIADEQAGGRRVIVTGAIRNTTFFAQSFSASLVPASGWGTQGASNSVVVWTPQIAVPFSAAFPGASSIDPFGRVLLGGTYRLGEFGLHSAALARIRVVDGILPDVIFRTNF